MINSFKDVFFPIPCEKISLFVVNLKGITSERGDNELSMNLMY